VAIRSRIRGLERHWASIVVVVVVVVLMIGDFDGINPDKANRVNLANFAAA
jgi:hypothetical protein